MSWKNWINSNVDFSDIEISEYLIERDELNSKSKKEDLVFKRFFLFNKLRNENKIKLSTIGEMFNRKHSTVVYGLNTYYQLKNDMSFEHVTSEYELIFLTRDLLIKNNAD